MVLLFCTVMVLYVLILVYGVHTIDRLASNDKGEDKNE